MRGIIEERLRALFSDYQHKFLSAQLEKMYEPHAIMNMLHMLIDECTELNPWMPIDENTPKNRDILMIFVDCGKYKVVTGSYYGLPDYETDVDAIYSYEQSPLFWQEIPKLPVSMK